jgi:hypothetical protein
MVGRSLEDSPTVKSSAKDSVREACWGKSETKRIKRVGERTHWMIREGDLEECYRQEANLPRR